MIICICNKLTDKSLKKACAKKCPSSCAEDIMSELGCKPVCGKCVCYIEDFIIPSLDSHTQPANA